MSKSKKPVGWRRALGNAERIIALMEKAGKSQEGGLLPDQLKVLEESIKLRDLLRSQGYKPR